MKKPANSPKVLVRAADLAAQGYTRFQIPALLRRGELTRMSRGLYYWTNAPLSAHSTIASVGKLVPNGIICLLTALRFHEIGTQNPGSVWVALPSNYKTPKLSNISISAVHFGTKFSKIGVAVVAIDGVSVKITNPARTVVDCFRFRNKIGLDIAIEALEEGVRKRAFTSDELIKMAQQCRIYSVMKPYMETIYR
jgi:predicted transcriptional regulator of viral defense system